MAAATVGVTVEHRGGRNERLQQVVRRGLPGLRQALEAGERWLPRHVERELQRFLVCGDPSEGFGWLVCGACEHHRLVAFSCKGRGFCPSCGGRRIAERAKRWVEALLPRVATGGTTRASRLGSAVRCDWCGGGETGSRQIRG